MQARRVFHAAHKAHAGVGLFIHASLSEINLRVFFATNYTNCVFISDCLNNAVKQAPSLRAVFAKQSPRRQGDCFGAKARLAMTVLLKLSLTVTELHELHEKFVQFV
jgi:hypothetical protein